MVKENCVINPLTNRAILIGSPAYNKIKQQGGKSIEIEVQGISQTKKN